MKPPEIVCCPLPAFDDTDLDSVRAAFGVAGHCPLQQAWRMTPEPDFFPAVVATGWWADSLLIFAELSDRQIFTCATGHNQRMWELGDTLEIFLAPENAAHYVELHVTPENYRLQLRIPDIARLRRARAENKFDHLLLPASAFSSRVWRQLEQEKWFVLAIIPAGLVTNDCRWRKTDWEFSFSRYDASHDRMGPVISSTSPHRQPDFHRREEWGRLRFAGREA